MTYSDALLEFVGGWESCRLHAYLDGEGVPTIAWGHTDGVRLGDVCSQDQADFWRASEINKTTRQVLAHMTREPTQQQLDAIVSLGYNAGVDGAKGIGESGLMARFNAGLDQECGDRFRLWNKDNGKVVVGLTKRREAERAIYLFADYSGRP